MYESTAYPEERMLIVCVVVVVVEVRIRDASDL